MTWRFNPLLEEAAAVLTAAAPAAGKTRQGVAEIRWALGVIYLDGAWMLQDWLDHRDRFVLTNWMPGHFGVQLKAPQPMGFELETPVKTTKFVVGTRALVWLHDGPHPKTPTIHSCPWREVLTPITRRSVGDLADELHAAAAGWPPGRQDDDAAERASTEVAVKVWERVRPPSLGGNEGAAGDQLSLF